MDHKRRISKKNGESKESKGVAAAILIVLTLAVIAGVIVFSPIGKNLMDSVVTPLFSCSDTKEADQKIVSALSQQENTPAASASPKPTEKAHEVITLEQTQFYILQMGAFTAREGAEDHAKEILRMGGGGVVYVDGSVFRVFAAAYSDEDSLAKVQSQVRSDGFEATPYITDKKAMKITLDGNQEAVSIVRESAMLLNDVPTRLGEICLSFDKGELLVSGACERIGQLSDQCRDSITELAKMNDASITPIRDLLVKYQQKLSTFLEEHDTINAEMISAELKHLQLSMIIDYISFFDRK